MISVSMFALMLFAATDGLPFGIVKPLEHSDTNVEIPWQVESLDITKPTQDLSAAVNTREQKSIFEKALDKKGPREMEKFGDEASLDIKVKGAVEKTGKEKAKKEKSLVSEIEEKININKPNITENSGEQIDIGTETQERKISEGDIEMTSFSDKEKIAQKSDSSYLSEQHKSNTEKPEKEGMLRDLAPGQDYVFYQNANGSFKLHRTPASWTDARLICYDEGAELASPESVILLEAMSAVLLTSRQPPLHIFTGINDLYSKGFFTSLRGTQLTAMPAQWAPREPDNVNHGSNCLVLQRNGLLLDSKCDDVYPYICYKRQQMSQINLCGTTDTEYVFDRHTKTCHKVHSESASWQEAYATCAREDAYLAIMNDEYEAKTLGSRAKRWAHIGISYWRKDLWMTIHGQTLPEAGFESWASGEPNDNNEERCGCLSDGLLVDIDCEWHPLPFICEKSALL